VRYLHFANISIDTQNQLLFRDNQAITLEPKVYELLLFFCRNSERLISKDELMMQVWTGSLVTDNTISRTLVKVRKALGDEAKSAKFIITIPRKGYQMLASFQQSEQPYENEQSADAENKSITVMATAFFNSTTNKVATFSVFLVLLALAWQILSTTDEAKSTALHNKQITPLTRAIGIEWSPAMSPDMSQLAYSNVDATSHLKQIKIDNQYQQSSQLISHTSANISKPVWSANGETLAFLYQNNAQSKTECKILTVRFNGVQSYIQDIENWKTVAECNHGSSPIFQFSADSNYLYFNNKQSDISGYQIFRVNLKNNAQEIIKQPNSVGRGNYQFNLSADGQKLVILNSEFAPNTKIYVLDITTSSLTETAKLSFLMRSVVWHHDSESLVHPSPHPAYQLWQSNLSGEKLAVVASSPTRITHLKRMPNGEDFLFSAYLLNRDLYLEPLSLSQNVQANNMPLDNSSVMDYLPALAHHSDSYAFVSKRSSKAEVYIANGKQEAAIKISQFNNSIKLYQLAFSPDDLQLLILADNQVYIYHIESKIMNELPIQNKGIKGVNWESNESILLSTTNVTNNNWQLMRYDLKQNILTPLYSNIEAGLFAKSVQKYFVFTDDSTQIMKHSSLNEQSESIGLFCQPTFINRKLNLKVTEHGLVCQSNLGDKYLTFYNFKTKATTSVIDISNHSDFDLNKQDIIYAHSKENVGDIMRTKTH